ncbi:MAG: hypothetical protein EOP48_09090 [Sphingobacteriales bacterium]|nr:MAG: hypothetical protein EOP48_09090 [Sphingobacteriales bacterium]
MIKVLEFIPKAIAWLQIATPSSLLGIGLGAAIYFYQPSWLTLTVAIFLCTIGIAAGAIWATKVHRRRGTVDFMSRVIATPELDSSSDNS